MKNLLLTCLLAFLLLSSIPSCKTIRDVNPANHNGTQTMNPDSITIFRVVITNYYFGRAQFITMVTEDSIETIRDDLNGNKTCESRPLLSNESKKMQQFLSAFPLDDLDEKYIDDKVEDGINIEFDISVNRLHKRIHVANYYQDNLGKLVNEIRPLLKEDYIGYRKEYFHHN